MRVKVSTPTPESLEKVKQIQLNKAKAFFQSCPFATRVYMSMKLGIPVSFLRDNWKEISGNDLTKN